ncbi:MAG: serine hydrolase [Candidatus Omnitrophota bacterium]
MFKYMKYIRQSVTYFFVAFCFMFVAGCSFQKEVNAEKLGAGAAIAVETKSGIILFKRNADKRFPPASTAKVMTAIIAIERLPLDTEITPSPNSLAVEPSKAGLKEGVNYKLEDLLAALLIKSANDAAVAIAEKIAVSEEKFAGLMNRKAFQLGMYNTRFATASGLPSGVKDSQYTTVKDLAKMMKYASKYRFIIEMMSNPDKYISGSDGQKIYLRTHNQTLLRGKEKAWGKTGFTREAKRTFVGIEPAYGSRIIFALLYSDDLWNDISVLKIKGIELVQARQDLVSERGVLYKAFDWLRRDKI